MPLEIGAHGRSTRRASLRDLFAPAWRSSGQVRIHTQVNPSAQLLFLSAENPEKRTFISSIAGRVPVRPKGMSILRHYVPIKPNVHQLGIGQVQRRVLYCCGRCRRCALPHSRMIHSRWRFQGQASISRSMPEILISERKLTRILARPANWPALDVITDTTVTASLTAADEAAGRRSLITRSWQRDLAGVQPGNTGETSGRPCGLKMP